MQQVPTITNIVVVPCKRTQHVVPNNVACYWPTMLRPFALALNSNYSNDNHNHKIFERINQSSARLTMSNTINVLRSLLSTLGLIIK